MSNTVNIASGVFKAILTFLGFCVIAAPLFKPESIISMAISMMILIVGVFVSRYVYKLIVRRGIGEVHLFNYRTDDVDNWKPRKGDGVITLSPEQLVNNFKQKKNLASKGIINIWGDWNEKNLDQENVINNINYSANSKKLVIGFKKGNRVTIIKPKYIYETPYYLKVMNASKILWEWQGKNAMTYEYTSKGIRMQTNSDWEIDALDTDMTQPAFIIKDY